MTYSVRLSARAQSDLKHLDIAIRRRIINKLRYYADSDHPLAHAKSLSGVLHGKYRFRIGDYRAIFSVDSRGVVTILFILTIQHRREVYA